MDKNKNWIVTVNDDRPIAEIANELSLVGFVVDSILQEIGSITGSATPGMVDNVRSIPGVIDITPDTTIDIGPPDSPNSW